MSGVPWSIWIGFDPREHAAFQVCRASIEARLTLPVPVYGLVLDELVRAGFYTRPVERRDSRLFDPISDAPMATEFAISRFLVPHLARLGRKPGERAGWALFMDCDMLVRENLVRLFELADPRFAVMCVKHRHAPPAGVKMDGQAQVAYARKNWSSFCLFNCDHPANAALTVELVNTLPGRDLHRFCWLDSYDASPTRGPSPQGGGEGLIGELSPEWNWLVGHNAPKVVHFTEGGPWFDAYADVAFSREWREARDRDVGRIRALAPGTPSAHPSSDPAQSAGPPSAEL